MIKIVIVDDHQMFLDGMISVLSADEGFEIVFVESSAKKALKKIKEDIPDIVITDISMPEMNGVEFVKILKKEFPEIKILVVSMFENILPFKNIDGFLLKETGKEKLIKVIKEIVLNDKKHFVGELNNENSIDFKKSILSEREKEIIRLIAKEYTTEEMAEKLIISKHTVEAHRKNIFFKLQVKNIAGLIKIAIHLGVVK
ncbi:response regulator transcription factor [Flavobacterium wongokense]|uniref:response regulator transcription factor n=1 Tax=Flavobacterium wongokense TaxID=2910674 RepID=UPI001F385309|nr:response regulator transcription factor [Flavobacterium sp. WG47]MCF6130831.1 response regulator transcription factor [Flavobacterium sp. WG47]